MAELADLAAPMVRASTCLHHNQALRLRSQKAQQLPPVNSFRNATDPSGHAPWS